jgi:Ni,Fe-hydrogenase I cytochrome b subunit
MVLSGLVLAQSDQLEASSFIFHDIKNLHDTAAWFFILFVPLHILSVVANSALKKK